MALTQRGFQDPSYLTRQAAFLGPVAAGSAGVTSKFIAHAALLVFGLTTYVQTLGTSTYTTGGTATVSGQQINLIVISNTNTTGTAVTLATTTIGPFLAGGAGLATAAIGGANLFALNTQTAGSSQIGVANVGGVPVPVGSQFYCVSGTDATAVTNCTVDYQIQAGAPVTV